MHTGQRWGGVAGEACGAAINWERLIAATPESQGAHSELQSGQKYHWVYPGQSRSR